MPHLPSDTAGRAQASLLGRIGRLDRKRGVSERRVVRCVICTRDAPRCHDERLPLLRVHVCRECRDVIARDTGWLPATLRGGTVTARTWENRGGRKVRL